VNIDVLDMIPSRKHMLSNSENGGRMDSIISFELLKQIAHLKSLFKIVILNKKI
jgi:hypothetical protein